MFKKIRNKILLLNMVMVSAVVIIAFAVIFATTYTRTNNENMEKLINGDTTHLTVSGTQVMQGTVMPAVQSMDSVAMTGFSQRLSPETGLSFSLLVDSAMNVVDVNSMVDLQPATYTVAAAQLTNAADESAAMTLEGRRWQFIMSPVTVYIREANGSAGILTTIDGEFSHVRFLDVTDSYKMIQSLALMLFGLTAVVLTVFFFISRFFANRAIKPMEDAFEKQSRFVADASHELKTPLSVINANCGVLYTEKGETVDSQIKWVDSIMRATDRMTGLVGGLLSLAGMDDAQAALQNSVFDLSHETNDAATQMEAAAIEKELVIHRKIEPGVMIESDKGLVRKILSIFMDNAVKYTNRGGEITIALTQEKRRIICSVKNTGSGIPQADIPHLFDRFFRGDPARSSENNGYGLDLSIAKAAAKQLGAEITADSVEGAYAEFTLVIRGD